MRVPAKPPVGHVVAYEYLWSSQTGKREDGAKVYPCSVVMADSTAGGQSIAYLLGISHSPPHAGERALQLPPQLKKRLGLDPEPAWIYLDQINVFVWPGPDLRPGSHISKRPGAADTCDIGALPDDWFAMLQREVVEGYRQKRMTLIKRTE